MIRASFFMVGMLFWAAPALGQMQMLNQDRSVEAAASRPGPPTPFSVAMDDAPGNFGQWLSAVIAEPTLAVGRVEAVASQNSNTSPARLQAIGAVRAEGELMDGASVLAVSEYRVQFAVVSPVSYNLGGFLSRATRTSIVSVGLKRSGGAQIFNIEIPSSDFEASLSQQGTLEPGVYEFTATSTIDVDIITNAEFSREATFVVQFDVNRAGPCSSDLDGDGDVDLADFSHFQREIDGPPPSEQAARKDP